jgi:iron complex transport system ATP-binding protein
VKRPILEAQQLTGGYLDRAIVHDVHLALMAGEWLSLVGANGSGKSTLLRLLSRILTPTHGAVLLDGKTIHQQPPRHVARQLSLLPQQQTIPEGLTVAQLVALGRSPHQAWWQWELSAFDHQKVITAIEQTQLQDFIDRPVEELSGGERQRAFLALALAQEPKVLLLDEPTTYLDVHYQLELLELLRRLNHDSQLTIITVLHELNLAARYSSRIALMKEGCLSAIGTPGQVLTLDLLADVFGVHVMILDTPVGLQICPLYSLNQSTPLDSIQQ